MNTRIVTTAHLVLEEADALEAMRAAAWWQDVPRAATLSDWVLANQWARAKAAYDAAQTRLQQVRAMLRERGV